MPCAQSAKVGKTATGRGLDSDLTDEQWDEIQPWVSDLPDRYNLPYRERDVVDAIRYQYHQNCEWDELPDAFPPPDDVQRHLHEWTEGSNRSVFELHEPGSFLSKVRVGLPDRDRGLTDADPGLDEEEVAIQQAIAAGVGQATPTTPPSSITSDTIARRAVYHDRRTTEWAQRRADERGRDEDQSPGL